MNTASSRPRVLYYAHDHGAGHVRHAARAAATGAFELSVATASPRAAVVLPAGTGLHILPSDVVAGHRQPADSRLHYTPTGPVIRDRFAALLDAARRVGPEVVVVDVSVEAALFLRLAGYPVIHRRMHGDRTDAAHELVYAEADHLIAYYGPGLEDPGWRGRLGAKTTFLGAPDTAGRLGVRAAARSGSQRTTPEIAVVTGTGGGGVALTDLARAAGQVPGASWHVYGPVRGFSGAVHDGGTSGVTSCGGSGAGDAGRTGGGGAGAGGEAGVGGTAGGMGRTAGGGTGAGGAGRTGGGMASGGAGAGDAGRMPGAGGGCTDGRKGSARPGGTERCASLPRNLVLHGWTDDVPARMRAADLVVVSAGYSAVADATASARPIVLAPEARPFDEQGHFAAAAHAAAGVPWCRWSDESADWAAAVGEALRDPASADRLAAEVLTEPGEYRRRWEDAVRAARNAQ